MELAAQEEIVLLINLQRTLMDSAPKMKDFMLREIIKRISLMEDKVILKNNKL